MKKALYCSVVIMCILGSPVAVAAGVGFSFGSLGSTVEGSLDVSDTVSARVAFGIVLGVASLDIDNRYFIHSGIDHSAILLDYHPWQGDFRLTAGAMKNTLSWFFQETGAASYEFDNKTFDGRNISLVTSAIHYDAGFGPYLGIGWSTGFNEKRALSFNGDFGVLYKSTPTLMFDAGCAGHVSESFCHYIRSSAQAEQDSFELDNALLDRLRFYPVVNLGLSYKF